jgi:RNA polymerase sigma factor for flagellar operon FliA
MNSECERNALVEAHLGFVRQVALRLARRLPQSIQADDLMQEGLIGLMQAAERFDESMGVHFEVYARRRVIGAMLSSIRRRFWREATAESLDEKVTCWIDCNRPTVEKPRHDEPASPQDLEADVAQKEEAREVRRAVAELPKREVLILAQFYGGDLTHLQIAPALGIGGNRVGQLHRGALRRLRRDLVHLRPAA